MENRLHLYAMNEHFALFSGEDRVDRDPAAALKHPEIVEATSFLSINSFGRLIRFFENNPDAVEGLPLFILTSDDFYGVEDYLRERSSKPAEYLGKPWESPSSARKFKSFLKYHGIKYLDKAFLDGFLDSQEPVFLEVLNLDSLMGLKEDLGALALSAAAALRCDGAIEAFMERYLAVEPGVDADTLSIQFKDAAGKLAGEPFDCESKDWAVSCHDRVRDHAIQMATRLLDQWRVFAVDASMQRDCVTGFLGGDSMPEGLGEVLDSFGQRIVWFEDSESVGFCELSPSPCSVSFVRRCADTVVQAVFDKRVFVCGNCKMPCISVQKVKEGGEGEQRFCSDSCRSSKFRRDKKADNA